MSNLVPGNRRLPSITTPRGAFVFMLGWLALLWVVELVDQLSMNALDGFGIRPRNIDSLWSILVAPFLHYGWNHLIANSLPFLILGWIVLISGIREFVVATIVSSVASGLFVWLLSPFGTLTAGASGLIFGWLTFVLFRGMFTRDSRQILQAVVIFVVYGSLLWGLIPVRTSVSWQGHLGGAVGGVLAAWLVYASDRRLPRSAKRYR